MLLTKNKNYTKILLICICLWSGFIVTNKAVYGEEVTSAVDQTEKIYLKVTGISCSSCIPNVKKALRSVHGVKRADMLTGNIAKVESEKGKVESIQLITALRAKKYDAIVIKANDVPKDAKKIRGFFDWLF